MAASNKLPKQTHTFLARWTGPRQRNNQRTQFRAGMRTVTHISQQQIVHLGGLLRSLSREQKKQRRVVGLPELNLMEKVEDMHCGCSTNRSNDTQT